MPLSALQLKQAELIRKATDGSAFIAPGNSLLVETLTTGTVGTDADLNALPAGYTDFGFLTTDGVQTGRDVATSDITSWGQSSPTRSDVTTDSSTFTIVPQETNLSTISTYTGADIAAITATSTSGEVKLVKPTKPSSRTYRLLVVSEDETADGFIWYARFVPRAKVTGYAAQNLSGGDEAITWGVTFGAEPDTELGGSEAWFFGGPGWFALLGAMGIPTA